MLKVGKYAENIYLLREQDEAGGGDYDSEVRLYVDDDKASLYVHAEMMIQEEHNRENECEECQEEKGICEKNCMKELKKNNNSFITCTCFEGISFEICKMPIKE